MVIHWAGEGSQVIVALTRDINPTATSTSNVYMSYDYGVNFTDVSDKLMIGASRSIIHMYYNSPVYNNHVSFQLLHLQFV